MCKQDHSERARGWKGASVGLPRPSSAPAAHIAPTASDLRPSARRPHAPHLHATPRGHTCTGCTRVPFRAPRTLAAASRARARRQVRGRSFLHDTKSQCGVCNAPHRAAEAAGPSGCLRFLALRAQEEAPSPLHMRRDARDQAPLARISAQCARTHAQSPRHPPTQPRRGRRARREGSPLCESGRHEAST